MIQDRKEGPDYRHIHSSAVTETVFNHQVILAFC